MRTWWTGAALLAAGLGWWVVDRVLTTLFPLSWGGPNIGGGFLLLVAAAVGVTGAILLLVSGSALLARRPRPQARALAVPLALDAALLVALVAVRALLPGDAGPGGGVAGVDGQVGVTVDTSGAPVLLLEVCTGAVDTVSVVGPNRGDRPNEVFAVLHAPGRVDAPTQVALLAPPPGWTGAPASLPLGTQELLIASAEGHQSTSLQVDFTGEDLTALDPGTVQYSEYDAAAEDLVPHRVARAGFHDVACARFAAAAQGQGG